MNHKERMLAEMPYKGWLDGLPEERMQCKMLLHEYNRCSPDNKTEKDLLLRKILGKTGKAIHDEAPFYCDYGYNIEVGENFYANFNCTILDVARVCIGSNVMLAPNVSLYTAGHPLYCASRNSGYEYGIAITIGNSVWIGGNAVVNPGVLIGDNSVIGSGSVVTRDVPADCIAAGNPCRVVRKITEDDKKYFFKQRVFDVDDYLIG